MFSPFGIDQGDILMRDLKRIVVKVGTSTLTHKTGLTNIYRMEKLVKVLADIKNSGKEIILVSSGAISVGMGKLGLKERPADIPSRQACAAVGQCELMYLYDKHFSEYNHKIAQVLLTRDVLDNPETEKNASNTFARLLEMGVIPIVNENDTVSSEELGQVFGDNDTLSAIVAVLVKAEGLVMLTDIDGLYDCDPRQNISAKKIHQVDIINDYIRSVASKAGSSRGTGGMITKLQAAEITMPNGIDMWIISGEQPSNLYKLNDGEKIGTYFKS